MSQYVNRILKEGLNLLQFAAICAPMMAIEHGYREVSPEHDEAIEASVRRINELVLMSAEERARLHQAAITEQEGLLREVWAAKVRVDAMHEQVTAWEPGENVDVQGLKRAMLARLSHGASGSLLEFHQASVDQLRTLTPEQYMEQLCQRERQSIKGYEESKAIEAERAAEWRAWREALAAAGVELEDT